MDQWTPANVAMLVGAIGIVIANIIKELYSGKKLAMIEAHVNSQKTSDQARIDSLQKENQMLRDAASEKKEIAAVLAQVVSAKSSTGL